MLFGPALSFLYYQVLIIIYTSTYVAARGEEHITDTTHFILFAVHEAPEQLWYGTHKHHD